MVWTGVALILPFFAYGPLSAAMEDELAVCISLSPSGVHLTFTGKVEALQAKKCIIIIVIVRWQCKGSLKVSFCTPLQAGRALGAFYCLFGLIAWTCKYSSSLR
jgi:hypothetical protein